mgnify:CR=1 FL=1
MRPYPFFPLLSNCCEEVSEEIHDFLLQRDSAVLQLMSPPHAATREAVLMGRLEPFLITTLNLLCEVEEGTADDLLKRSDEKITVNGWSKRLLELHTMRLAYRRREGRYWIYTPLERNIRLWA